MSSIEDITDIYNKYTELIKNEGQEILKLEFKNMFDNHPDIEQVVWTQYTPYFNDGDPCEFSVHDPSFKLVGNQSEQEDDWGRVGYYDLWDLDAPNKWDKEQRRWVSSGEPPKYAKVAELKEFVKRVFSNDDIFEKVFGDHCEIFASRDGFSIEQYDHE